MALAPTSIKIPSKEKSWLKRQALAEGHGYVSRIVVSLIRKAMHRHG